MANSANGDRFLDSANWRRCTICVPKLRYLFGRTFWRACFDVFITSFTFFFGTMSSETNKNLFPLFCARRVVATVASPAVAGGAEDDSNFHKLLRRLECEGLQRIRMFTTICIVYALFWGPLFLVVAFGSRASEEGRGLASVGPPKDPVSHQVTLYICFAHAFINPTVFLLLHSGLREAACSVLACCFGRECRSPSGDSAGNYGGSFGQRGRLQRQQQSGLTGLVDYDRIINFNGAPSFLSPVPAFPPLPPVLAAANTSSTVDSRPM